MVVAIARREARNAAGSGSGKRIQIVSDGDLI